MLGGRAGKAKPRYAFGEMPSDNRWGGKTATLAPDPAPGDYADRFLTRNRHG